MNDKTSANFKEMKLQFEIMKQISENEKIYWKPQKAHSERIEGLNLEDVKRVKSVASTKIKLKSTYQTCFDLQVPQMPKELERAELKNRWDRFKNEMINAKYYCDIEEETNIYWVSLRSIYLNLNENYNERNIEFNQIEEILNEMKKNSAILSEYLLLKDAKAPEVDEILSTGLLEDKSEIVKKDILIHIERTGETIKQTNCFLYQLWGRVNFMLHLMNDKMPKSIPRDLLAQGSSIKTATQQNFKRKQSILGKKAFAKTLISTPKNKLVVDKNIALANQQNNMKELSEKVKFYLIKLDELLRLKKVKYGVDWSISPSVSYKALSKSGSNNVKFDTFADDWISCMNRIDMRISMINSDQKIFYETTKDEFRSYLDLNREEIEADSWENPTNDDSQDSQSEYMQDRNQFRADKIQKSIPKPKNRFKTFDRLFQGSKTKTVTKFQKQAKIIKDFNRQEYDNRMFGEVFNAVNQPQILTVRKAQIESMLKIQTQNLKKFLNNDRANTPKSRQVGISAFKTSPNNSVLKRTRVLQSARAERSRMNK
jgi:hypothetical protein